ncbi:hypothetical protein QKW52_03540 [Bacillus sonorensis]|nr:hypothetical protein [Bacillus sonorensis]
MFSLVDLTFFGLIGVFLYFLYDVVKNRKRTSLIRKIVFLSFLVYLCAVWHFTIGEINIPPQREFAHIDVQFIPFFLCGIGIKCISMAERIGFFGIPSS